MNKNMKLRLPKRKNFLFLIGIGEYLSSDFDDLTNPVTDCESLKKVLLERYDFELISDPIYNQDATRENIINSLNVLQSIVTDQDNLIIYFAGHGEMNPTTRKGFWIPHDANRQVSDFIPNSTIKDFLEGIQAKHIFLCCDACFSGTFLTKTRSAFNGTHYLKIDSLKSRLALTSGGEHKVSDGQSIGNSPFAKYFVQVLEKNTNKYISASEIINFVTKTTGANSYQQPLGTHIENVGHEGGNMVFHLVNKYVENETMSKEIIADSETKTLESTEPRGKELTADSKVSAMSKSLFSSTDELIEYETLKVDTNLFPFYFQKELTKNNKKLVDEVKKILFDVGNDDLKEELAIRNFNNELLKIIPIWLASIIKNDLPIGAQISRRLYHLLNEVGQLDGSYNSDYKNGSYVNSLYFIEQVIYLIYTLGGIAMWQKKLEFAKLLVNKTVEYHGIFNRVSWFNFVCTMLNRNGRLEDEDYMTKASNWGLQSEYLKERLEFEFRLRIFIGQFDFYQCLNLLFDDKVRKFFHPSFMFLGKEQQIEPGIELIIENWENKLALYTNDKGKIIEGINELNSQEVQPSISHRMSYWNPNWTSSKINDFLKKETK